MNHRIRWSIFLVRGSFLPRGDSTLRTFHTLWRSFRLLGPRTVRLFACAARLAYNEFRISPSCLVCWATTPVREFCVDVAYELTPLVAAKLVVYTFGTLIHLFMMVLILGNRRLRRLEWLLFALMSALFMWYAGNLLALNISLYYGAGPAVLSGFSRTVTMLGFIAAVPLLVHVQVEYFAGLVPSRFWQRLVVACFYLPVISCPWLVGRILGRLGLEPLVALGPPVRLLVLWAVGALIFAVGINVYLNLHRRAAAPTLARFHGYLAGLQGLLALGWAIAYLPHALPPVGGLGGYFVTGLMLAGITPQRAAGLFHFSLQLPGPARPAERGVFGGGNFWISDLPEFHASAEWLVGSARYPACGGYRRSDDLCSCCAGGAAEALG